MNKAEIAADYSVLCNPAVPITKSRQGNNHVDHYAWTQTQMKNNFLEGVKWVIEEAKNFKDEFKGNRDYNQASIDVQQRFYKYLESLKE